VNKSGGGIDDRVRAHRRAREHARQHDDRVRGATVKESLHGVLEGDPTTGREFA
jgi:hypothetical protein